jgi:signal transduction histidine kinase
MNAFFRRLRADLDIPAQCKKYKVSLWACPNFLFLVMGFIIIVSILSTNIVAQRYSDDSDTGPYIVALIVLVVASILILIGHLIVASFTRMAEAGRAKAEFVSIISHQLRSPLTAMRWQLELLLKKEHTEELRMYLRTVYSHNERMIRLVNDLLTANRIEDGRMVLQSSLSSLSEITQTSVEGFRQFANSSNLELVLKIPKTMPKSYFDESHMRWVIDNLIDNAIRYATPKTTVLIDVKRLPNKLRFTITNNGVGIAPGEEPYIFQKFFRADSMLRLRTEGNGLGLFIAKSIVTASGGHMGFESIPNKKTTFWFSLPIRTKPSGQKQSLRI